MDLALKDKTVWITGGTCSIGYAIAKMFLQEGARVFIGGRTEARVAEAVASLREHAGARVEGCPVNLLDESSIRDAYSFLSRATMLDVLVNNVGGPATGNPLKLSLDDWDRGYRALLRSVILLSQLVVPKMAERRWGRILTVTSTSARELIPGLPVSSTFRSALTAWAKEVAKAAGRDGVLVNNLLPGPTNTARLKELAHTHVSFVETMATETALGRIAEPEEVARVAVFLCSAANSYMTGGDVLVDGGYTKAL